MGVTLDDGGIYITEKVGRRYTYHIMSDKALDLMLQNMKVVPLRYDFGKLRSDKVVVSVYVEKDVKK